MYEGISKMVTYSSRHLGWSGKEAQKYLYLVISTAVWFLMAGVFGSLVQLLTGSFMTLDVVVLALFGALLPGFYGGILYLYHTAVDEE